MHPEFPWKLSNLLSYNKTRAFTLNVCSLIYRSCHAFSHFFWTCWWNPSKNLSSTSSSTSASLFLYAPRSIISVSTAMCYCRYLHPSVSDQILLLHCMLGIPSDQLHSIRITVHLMVVAYCTFSLMSFTYWPIVIHLDHLQSIFFFKFAEVIFRVFSFIRSRVSSTRSIMVSRCMRRSNKVPVTIISIITCWVIDFSSKPCWGKTKFFMFYV